MSEHDLLCLLERRLEESGNQRELARQLDVCEQDISTALTGARPPSKKLCKSLGYRSVRTITYTYESEVANG